MNILVIAPHHDDEVLGCGGTIIKHRKKGARISVVYITAGWSGIPSIKSKERATKIREREARVACKILGIEKIFFFREKDRSLIYNGETVQRLIRVIRKVNPEIIYAPHHEEKDFEHKISHEITKEAFWLSKSPYFPKLGKPAESLNALYLYEVWTPMREYSATEDITEVAELKAKTLRAYKSQMKHLNLVDAILGLNTYRGSMVGIEKKFVEVFQVERP